MILIISAIVTIPYIYVITKHNLHMLQQNFYNENNRYIKWGMKNTDKVFMYFEIPIILITFFNIFLQNEFLCLINLLYITLFYFVYEGLKREQVKIPLKVTSRVKRLSVTIFILYLIPLILANAFDFGIFMFIYSVMIFINYFIVYISNIINIPIEKYVFHYYKSKAVKKLKLMNNMEVIGITGSYGKTSSKNILKDILSVKFNALATPHNYNTQYGLILTINNYLDKFNDVFIAEMGAFKRGRIKLLCDLVKPKYGIITTIGKAHLDTFGSVSNIQKGKFELIESLPSDGVAILNKDDELQCSYELKNDCQVIWIGIDNKKADIYASDIKMNRDGMNFLVHFKNKKKPVKFHTKLLGKPNIYNILAGIAFGNYLKMTDKELQLGVEKIKPIEHRLELKKLPNYTIIDDAYNSNPVGANMALDVLNLMDGIKVVVTPGMIELGEEQDTLNKEFGEHIGKVADLVILVGEKQTKPIYNGLIESGYNPKKIKVINNVKDAFKIIDDKNFEKEAYILLENDLPDIFNEKE